MLCADGDDDDSDGDGDDGDDERRWRRRRRRGNFFRNLDLVAAVDSVKFLPKSDLSSRFFGRLKFLALGARTLGRMDARTSGRPGVRAPGAENFKRLNIMRVAPILTIFCRNRPQRRDLDFEKEFRAVVAVAVAVRSRRRRCRRRRLRRVPKNTRTVLGWPPRAPLDGSWKPLQATSAFI